MRYRCLILDHDDTVMDSTREIHYPAFLAALARMRPYHYVSLEDYFKLNFKPGFLEYCENVLQMTSQELDTEYGIWQSYVRERIPRCFTGIPDIIRRQKAEGGLVCVVSHSVKTNILRDYAANDLPEPDAVFGWEMPREQRKPAPYPVERIREMFDLRPAECLVVDDLKPGLDMAGAAGVDFACAAWAHRIESIRRYMRERCKIFFEHPSELNAFLFD